MRKRVAAIWWGLFLLAAACLVAENVQYYRLRSAFAVIRATESTDDGFAVKATTHIQERQRRFARERRDATGASWFARFPLGQLDGTGGCSQRSTLLIAVLDAHGIRARKLLIGLTEDYATHVVVEALLGGKWRVLDPLFGYSYPLDNGELATAEDLRHDAELVARVARADPQPFPIRYRLESFNYRAATRFNWFRLPVTKTVRDHFGPAADAWAPPAMWERPLGLAASILVALLFPLTWLYLRRREATRAA
jgi:hypothetical protein